ncbi:hypothetical protein P389DRAFT_166510 [Cystobasidium minutum MCA 4210]|uniref:uncharacterized protein n=1 Tax=Cystobasidium minutum MCA 4210 TaxID=1397322 RepID=UPI0034D01DEA|eukprot:jgi/Rhomi1/166510/fgenesh1_kg.2_\
MFADSSSASFGPKETNFSNQAAKSGESGLHGSSSQIATHGSGQGGHLNSSHTANVAPVQTIRNYGSTSIDCLETRSASGGSRPASSSSNQLTEVGDSVMRLRTLAAAAYSAYETGRRGTSPTTEARFAHGASQTRERSRSRSPATRRTPEQPPSRLSKY